MNALAPLLLAFLPVFLWLLIARASMGRMKTNGGWVQFIPAAIALASSLLKPKQKAAAVAPSIDLNAEAKNSIAGNLQNQDDIETLLSRANSFNQSQASSLMEQAMPGYGALSKKLTGQANELLTDPYSLPQDVEKNIERLAAERGISAGTKGEFNDFSLLRDFGINSLQYGQNRIGQAQSITQMLASLAPKVNPLSPMSFYVTPTQTADVAAGNRSREQAGLNASAAANNLNSDNMWDGIMGAVGKAWGAMGSAGGNDYDPTAGNIGTD